MTNQKTPFGIKILSNETISKFALKDVIKSQILGNALFIAQSHIFPEKLNLTEDKFYRNLTDQQKKIMTAELDRSKFPNYDLSNSIKKFIVDNWIEKTVFEKKVNQQNPVKQNYKK